MANKSIHYKQFVLEILEHITLYKHRLHLLDHIHILLTLYPRHKLVARWFLGCQTSDIELHHCHP